MRHYLFSFLILLVSLYANNLGIKGLSYEASKMQSLLDENLLIFHNISLQSDEITLKAQKLIVNYITKDFIAEGDVKIQDKNFSSHSRKARGNLLSKNFTITNTETQSNEWSMIGELVGIKENEYVINKVSLTTCTNKKGSEHYHLTADKIIYTPKRGFRAYNATFYLQQIPIFYLPYFPGRFEVSNGALLIRPAYSVRWGISLLTSLAYHRSENSSSNLLIDLRLKRGFAIGNKTIHQTNKSSTEFLIYGLKDENPPTSNGRIGKFSARETRFRSKLKHYSQIDENTSLKANIDYVSDLFFINDFFRDELDKFTYSAAHIGLEHFGKNYDFSLEVQPRINNFNTTVERLPQAILTINPYYLWGNLYYSQETSANFLRLNWLEADIARAGGANEFEDYQTGRFDSKHFLHYYGKLAFLNFTSRVGFRAIHYTSSSQNAVNVDQLSNLAFIDDPYIDRGGFINNYDANGDKLTRLIPEYGLDINFTSEAEFTSYNHSITPYINWSLVPQVDESRDNIPFFDDIDRITGNHFIRFGFNQKFILIEKKESQLSFHNYVDYHFEDSSRKNIWGDWGTITSLTFNKNWSFQLETLHNVEVARFHALLATLSYKQENLTMGVTYINRQNYLSQDIYSSGTFIERAIDPNYYARKYEKLDSLRFNFNKTLSDKWAIEASTHFDFNRQELIFSTIATTYSTDCLNYKIGFIDTGEDQQITFDLTLRNLPHSILKDILK